MCWSIEASIITWIIGVVAAIYLLCRRIKNDIIMGLLVLTYSSMQLWESFMWYDQKCGTINKIGTQLAYFALWSHVLAIAIGLYIEYNAIVPMFIGIGLLGYAVLARPTTWGCSKPKNGSRHLVWGFNPGFYTIVFTIAIALCLFYIKPLNLAFIISGLFLSTFLLSLLYGWNSDTTGSFWCWICVAFCFVFIAINEKYSH
jgi:hypothetical protein